MVPLGPTGRARAERPATPTHRLRTNGLDRYTSVGRCSDHHAPRRPADRRPAATGAPWPVDRGLGPHRIAALAGGVALLTGGIDFGAVLNERLPFASPTLAGITLIIVVALPLAVLAWAGWTRSERTGDIALVAGVLLVGWILVQIVVLRRVLPLPTGVPGCRLLSDRGIPPRSPRPGPRGTRSRRRRARDGGRGRAASAPRQERASHPFGGRGRAGAHGVDGRRLGAGWRSGARDVGGGLRGSACADRGRGRGVAVAPPVAATHDPATSVSATPTSRGLRRQRVGDLVTSRRGTPRRLVPPSRNRAAVVMLDGEVSTSRRTCSARPGLWPVPVTASCSSMRAATATAGGRRWTSGGSATGTSRPRSTS